MTVAIPTYGRIPATGTPRFDLTLSVDQVVGRNGTGATYHGDSRSSCYLSGSCEEHYRSEEYVLFGCGNWNENTQAGWSRSNLSQRQDAACDGNQHDNGSDLGRLVPHCCSVSTNRLPRHQPKRAQRAGSGACNVGRDGLHNRRFCASKGVQTFRVARGGCCVGGNDDAQRCLDRTGSVRIRVFTGFRGSNPCRDRPDVAEHRGQQFYNLVSDGNQPSLPINVAQGFSPTRPFYVRRSCVPQGENYA